MLDERRTVLGTVSDRFEETQFLRFHLIELPPKRLSRFCPGIVNGRRCAIFWIGSLPSAAQAEASRPARAGIDARTPGETPHGVPSNRTLPGPGPPRAPRSARTAPGGTPVTRLNARLKAAWDPYPRQWAAASIVM